MPKVIEAVYENGVFKPLEKVELREGERLKIILKRTDIRKFIMCRLPEEKIRELERRFESENIY